MGSTGMRRAKNTRTKVCGITAIISMLLAAVMLVFANGAAATPGPVDLGTAGTFAVLAGTTVTNTGPSTISGDLGVSPGTAITGFPPGTVTGTAHSADAVAAQAQSDLTAAFNDAAGRTPTDATAFTELGGMTLTPGVYGGGALSITGTLTLNAQGDANAVFIFQAQSTLITATGSSVSLINGAQACNATWEIGSSATLAVDSSFTGNVLALTSITAETGAQINGSLLARNGAVTLDSNQVTASPCATTAPTTTSSVPGSTTTTASSVPGSSTTSVPGSTTTSSVPGPTTTSSVPGPTTTSSVPGPTTTTTTVAGPTTTTTTVVSGPTTTTFIPSPTTTSVPESTTLAPGPTTTSVSETTFTIPGATTVPTVTSTTTLSPAITSTTLGTTTTSTGTTTTAPARTSAAAATTTTNAQVVTTAIANQRESLAVTGAHDYQLAAEAFALIALGLVLCYATLRRRQA
jgi:Ice-binding-like